MSKPKRETLKEAGYRYVEFDQQAGGHILRHVETGKLEVWFANKNHASYGLRYKNTHLEFARSV